MKYTYLAVGYRQSKENEGPYLLSFVAPVDEIRQWAGVPRRAHADGFQRLKDDSRVSRISSFFKEAANQSPTAVVVGISDRPVIRGSVQVEVLGSVDSYLAGELPATASNNTEQALSHLGRGEALLLCRLVLTVDTYAATEEVAEEYRKYLEERLSEAGELEDEADVAGDAATGDGQGFGAEEVDVLDGDERNAVDVSDPAETIRNDDRPAQQEGDDVGLHLEEEDEDDVDVVDLRESNLRRILSRMSHPSWIRRHSADIQDLAKPATIIDGQHRALGAAALGEDVPFTVVALMDAAWSEQIYQFTILNNTAKPLPAQFVAGNAVISLTDHELSALRDRLKIAGIRVKDVDIFKAVGGDSRSPFFDLIAVGERADDTKLGYKTMVRLGTAWFDRHPDFIKRLTEDLYPGVNNRVRTETWQNGDWQDFIWAFWGTVRDHYVAKDAALWEPGQSRLMVTAVLAIVQKEIFDLFDLQLNFWGENSKAKDAALAHLRNQTNAVLPFLPAELFLANWSVVGIQGSRADREKVADVIRQLLQSRGKYVWRRSALITK